MSRESHSQNMMLMAFVILTITAHISASPSAMDEAAIVPEESFHQDEAIVSVPKDALVQVTLQERIKKASKINYDQMVTNMQVKARKELAELEKQVDDQKNLKKAARRNMRARRKEARQQVRACRKSINVNQPYTTKSSQCKKFFSLLKSWKPPSALLSVDEDPADEDLVQCHWGKKGRACRQHKRQQRKERRQKKKEQRQERRHKRQVKRNERKHKRQEKRNERKQKRQHRRMDKRALKGQRRLITSTLKKIRSEINQDWKDACSRFKEFKKRIKGCKYKIKHMPHMMAKLKPHVQKELSKSKSDGKNNDAAEKGNDTVKKTDEDKKFITSETILKKYFTETLMDVLEPVFFGKEGGEEEGGEGEGGEGGDGKLVQVRSRILQKGVNGEESSENTTGQSGGLVGTIEKALWDILDPIYEVLTSALVALVGEVPFVGGILASIVSQVMDMIWTAVQNVVNRVLNTICAMLLDKVEETIVDDVFEVITGKKDEGGEDLVQVRKRVFKVKDVSDAVKRSQKAIAAPFAKKFARDAAKYEKEAVGVDEKMRADALKMSHQFRGLDKADEAELLAEDAKDEM